MKAWVEHTGVGGELAGSGGQEAHSPPIAASHKRLGSPGYVSATTNPCDHMLGLCKADGPAAPRLTAAMREIRMVLPPIMGSED